MLPFSEEGFDYTSPRNPDLSSLIAVDQAGIKRNPQTPATTICNQNAPENNTNIFPVVFLSLLPGKEYLDHSFHGELANSSLQLSIVNKRC